jgi:hypothetical protein
MATSARAFLTTLPSVIKLGPVYAGARIEGSLQVLGADSCGDWRSPE